MKMFHLVAVPRVRAPRLTTRLRPPGAGRPLHVSGQHVADVLEGQEISAPVTESACRFFIPSSLFAESEFEQQFKHLDSCLTFAFVGAIRLYKHRSGPRLVCSRTLTDLRRSPNPGRLN